MVLYKYIFLTSLIFTNLTEVGSEKNPDLHFETGLEKPSPLSIGLIFFVKINNTSDNIYDLEIKPDECCLEDDDDLNCDYLKVFDGCKDSITNGSIKTLKIVAPLLDVFERKGYCTVLADSKSKNKKNKRNTLTFHFDTKSGSNNIDFPKNYKACKTKDSDPFNNCEPVNCDTYYNSKKSYFSRKVKRCVEVPSCVSEDDFESPAVIYNRITNKCIEEALVDEDLNYVKSLSTTGKAGKHRKAKEVLIITRYRPNATDFFDGVEFVDDVVKTTTKSKNQHYHFTKFKPHKTHYTTNSIYNTVPTTTTQPECNNDCMKTLIKKYLVNNRYTFLVLALIVTVQCFLICTMFYCLSKTCNCFNDKKVVRNFFNYRHDASVTTPLIGTSNIDTETTDCQYVSDSSNVDQKIKCYKACQKEINNNMKVSMSDDILSKCLNRRDWKKVSKSEAVTKDGEISQKILDEIKETHHTNTKDTRKYSETKVVFEDEITKEQKPKVSNDDTAKIINDKKLQMEGEYNISSEKEIKCHSYNCFEAHVTGIQPTSNASCFKSDKSKRGTISLSTEKGAQAYFSNDSIDDFLSERGVIYLAGENVSKYTFSSDSNEMKPSTTSSVSSKTSKNFVKNVLSLLHKKSKQGPSSDPGQNKDVDLEVIHMSRASVYTSSNDSDCVKTFKRKDSRTSF